MSPPPDPPTSQRDRLPPGQAAGTRPRRLGGWSVLLRRRFRARLTGKQYADRLISHGMTVGRQLHAERQRMFEALGEGPGYVG